MRQREKLKSRVIAPPTNTFKQSKSSGKNKKERQELYSELLQIDKKQKEQEEREMELTDKTTIEEVLNSQEYKTQLGSQIWLFRRNVIRFCVKYNIPNSAVEKLKSVNAFDVNRFIDLYKRVSNKDLLGYSKKERDLIAIIGREAFIKTIKKMKDERVHNACENG